jgi:ankyrin repeat protein
MNSGLADVIEKLRTHPQFLGAELDHANPNQRGAMGDTLLHIAVEIGSIEDVMTLIAAGADVNSIGDIGNTPVHSAAMLGKTEVAMRLLEFGGDPTRRNEFGESAVDVAKIGGHNGLAAALDGYVKRGRRK